MNNYFEYYNYMNNSKNKELISHNKNFKDKKNDYETDPYTAFIRGNLFSDLYTPYKNYKPAELNPKSEKEHAMLLAQMYGFAAHELTLYLDTHPQDSKAIKLRSKYMNMYQQAMAEYESKYGPIELESNLLDQTPWGWNTKYWPWEGEKNV